MAVYDNDFYAWCVGQAEALHQRQTRSLDWENLAEELDGMARKEPQELTSHLTNLFQHCLKWQYADSDRWHRERSWKLSIVTSRQEARTRLENSPSLGNPETFNLCLEKAYRDARARAGAALGLSTAEWESKFPAECPWSRTDFLDAEDFPPGIDDAY